MFPSQFMIHPQWIFYSLYLLNKMDIQEEKFSLMQKEIWKDYPPDYYEKLQKDIQKYYHKIYSPYEQTYVYTEPLVIKVINLPFVTIIKVDNFLRNPYWPKNPSESYVLSIQNPYLRWFYLTFRPGSITTHDFDD